MLSFGKVEYAHMAAHMAMSLKHYHPDTPITLVCDARVNDTFAPAYRRFVDSFVTMKGEHYLTNGAFDPGKAKVHLPLYAPYDRTVYLDVDGIAIGDCSILFTPDAFFAAEQFGEGKIGDAITYNIWATNEAVWRHFGLANTDTFRTVQTSYVVYNQGKQLKDFAKRSIQNLKYPIEDVMHEWGKTIPDELIVAGTLAQMKHEPHCGFSPIYYGHSYALRNLTDIQAKHCILSMYGNGRGTTLVKQMYLEMYNRHCMQIARKFNLQRIFPIEYLMRSKHANRV